MNFHLHHSYNVNIGLGAMIALQFFKIQGNLLNLAVSRLPAM